MISASSEERCNISSLRQCFIIFDGWKPLVEGLGPVTYQTNVNGQNFNNKKNKHSKG